MGRNWTVVSSGAAPTVALVRDGIRCFTATDLSTSPYDASVSLSWPLSKYPQNFRDLAHLGERFSSESAVEIRCRSKHGADKSKLEVWRHDDERSGSSTYWVERAVDLIRKKNPSVFSIEYWGYNSHDLSFSEAKLPYLYYTFWGRQAEGGEDRSGELGVLLPYSYFLEHREVVWAISDSHLRKISVESTAEAFGLIKNYFHAI